MQNVLLMLGSFILYIFFDSLGLSRVSIQFMMLGIWRGLLEPVFHPKDKEEWALIEYPKQRYRKKKRYDFFHGFKFENVPVELVWMDRILTIQFIVCSVFLWITGDGSKVSGTVIEQIFVLCAMLTGLVSLNQIYKVAFYNKYKRLSKCNWRYRLGWDAFGQQPQKNKIGKCNIIEEQKISRRKYYTVQEKRTGNVYKKVMYCGVGRCDISKEYMLYEICKVKYII